jgi:hypothetical protein
MTTKTNRERAVIALRELANRVENSEELSDANIMVELLFEHQPEHVSETKITDSLDVNRPAPSGYRITVKADFPKEPHEPA